MMATKVSIMITCYNLQDSIETAIKSVIAQEMPFEWELLIGDDGSNDDTVAIVNKWVEKYPNNISVYVMDRSDNEQKNGTRAARNRANLLEQSTGEFLIFLDGDDQFLGKEKIIKQVRILESDSDKRFSGVAHNIIAYNVENDEKHPLADENILDGPIDTKKYIKWQYFHTNTILFRRECIGIMLNDEYRDYLNDNFITFIILQHGQLYYLHNLWAQYNLTGQGLWTGKKRVYGCFRNIIIYELEKEINPSLEKELFIRNMSNFRHIIHNYSFEDIDTVRPLVDRLTDPPFHYTLLLFNSIQNKSGSERGEIKGLKHRLRLYALINRLTRIPVYLKKLTINQGLL